MTLRAYVNRFERFGCVIKAEFALSAYTSRALEMGRRLLETHKRDFKFEISISIQDRRNMKQQHWGY
jgi:hypothetical protein